VKCLLEFYNEEGEQAARFKLIDPAGPCVFTLGPGIAQVKVTLSSASDPAITVAEEEP
jgi:hypothetical protein